MALLYQTSAIEDLFKKRTNPARKPATYRKMLEQISQWADPEMDWFTTNEKLTKEVAGKSFRGKKEWLLMGISLMPAQDALKFFTKPKRGGGRAWDHERLKKFNISKKDVTRMGDLCPGATEGCKLVCLSSAGCMVQTGVVAAGLRRLIVLKKERHIFLHILAAGIARLQRTAKGMGKGLGIRLNIVSDLPWESYKLTIDKDMANFLRSYGVKAQAKTYPNIMALFPKVQFYDYTKIPKRMNKFLGGQFPKNYYLTWSLAETPANRMEALAVLKSRRSTVAAPFAVTSRGKTKKPLPRTLTLVDRQGDAHTFRVIDADKHDFRPIDPKGTISGLRFKIPGGRGLKGLPTGEKIRRSQEFVLPYDEHVVIYI